MPPDVKTAKKRTCVFVDDDAFVSGAYQIVLEEGGYRVCNAAASEPDAMEAILRRRPDKDLRRLEKRGAESVSAGIIPTVTQR